MEFARVLCTLTNGVRIKIFVKSLFRCRFNLIRQHGTFLVSENTDNSTLQVTMPCSSYESIILKKSDNPQKQVFEAFIQIISCYELNDMQSAISVIEKLNKDNPKWVTEWPATRCIIGFFAILSKNNQFPLMLNYKKMFEMNGYGPSTRYLEFCLYSAIKEKNYAYASQILKQLESKPLAYKFTSDFILSWLKQEPVDVAWDMFKPMIPYLSLYMRLQPSFVEEYMHTFRRIHGTNRNYTLEHLKSQKEYQLAVFLFRLMKFYKYELTQDQIYLIGNWFKRYFTKSHVKMRKLKYYSYNLSECPCCGYRINMLKPPRTKTYQSLCLELKENIEKIVIASGEKIQREFKAFQEYISDHFPIFSVLDYSNLRNMKEYVRALIETKHSKRPLTDEEMFDKFEKFWKPILNKCPRGYSRILVVPNYFRDEILFLRNHENISIFFTNYMKEDMLCIYALAFTYLQSISANIKNNVIPKIITSDEYSNLHKLAPKNVQAYRSFIYQSKGYIRFENSAYRLYSNTYDRNIMIGHNSFHFPFDDGCWLCVELIP